MKTNAVACFILLLLLCFTSCSKEQVAVEESISSDENVSSEEPISSEETSSICVEFIIESKIELPEEPVSEETISSKPAAVESIVEIKAPVVSSYDYVPMSENLKSHIKHVSEFYGIEERIVYNIIYLESRFNKDARNKLCYGLMQVNKKYAGKYITWGDEIDKCVPTTDIMNPYTNIVIGIRILKSWKNESIRLGYEQTKSYIEMYNKGYGIGGSTRYADRVSSMDLSTIDFSGYVVVE